MPDLSGLDKFRNQEPVKSQPEQVKVRVGVAQPVILAVDQSIANTGWIVMHYPQVIAAGVIKTEPVAKGHEDTLARTYPLFTDLSEIVKKYRPTLIVHELPPVGGRMMRPESSLVAATVVRFVGLTAGIKVEMVSAQSVKKRFTGNANAKKGALKTALLELWPVAATIKPFNEHVVDALGIALYRAEQE